MKTIIILAVFLVSAGITTKAYSQGKIEKAKEYQENYEYSKAIAIYEEVGKRRQIKKPEVIRDIAHSYLMMNDLNSAQMWLSKVNSFSVYSPNEVLQYAFTLKTAGDYDNAIAQFRKFEDLFPDRAKKVPEWINACVLSEEWIKNPKLYKVENMFEVNTPYSEFGVTGFKDGMLFTTDRRDEDRTYSAGDIFGWTGNPYLRFYHMPENGMENMHSEINDLNTQFHNGPGVYDKNNDILYYTQTRMQMVKREDVNSNPTEFDIDAEPEQWINRLEIYSARFRNGAWENAVPFEYNNIANYSVGHPALSPDGNIIYFASDMPGGFGSSDIWFCQKLNDGSWSVPVNAGPFINSDGKEVFPVIDKDGTLYFSSDGLAGMGGLDIFAAKGSRNNWSVPENMKYPVNSPKDDFLPYFTEPGIMGYLSSNRDGGVGADDIYSFSKQVVLLVRTFEKKTDGSIVPLPGTNIEMQNITTNVVSNGTSNETGEYSKSMACGADLNVKGSKDGYIGQAKTIDAICSSGYDSLFVDLILDKIELNKTFVLENIYYDFDKWNIRSDAAVELNKLVTILKDHPEIDIELSSHTDSRGTYDYNDRLSKRRAESAVAYIISRGIDNSRITAKGYGERKMRVDCPDGVNCSEDNHQLNRRTEFTITNIRK